MVLFHFPCCRSVWIFCKNSSFGLWVLFYPLEIYIFPLWAAHFFQFIQPTLFTHCFNESSLVRYKFHRLSGWPSGNICRNPHCKSFRIHFQRNSRLERVCNTQSPTLI